MILCNVVNNMMLTVNGCDCMEALNAMVAEKERVQLLQKNCRFNKAAGPGYQLASRKLID